MNSQEYSGDTLFKTSDIYDPEWSNNSISINVSQNIIKKKIENENINNKRLNCNSHINIKSKSHLETVLETVNENNESEYNNISINNNPNTNYKESSYNKLKKNEFILSSEQKNLESDNKINYSENNTTSVLSTLVINNTKKSLYLLKSEKTD